MESTLDSYLGSGLNLTGTSSTVMQHWPVQNRLRRLLAGIASCSARNSCQTPRSDPAALQDSDEEIRTKL